MCGHAHLRVQARGRAVLRGARSDGRRPQQQPYEQRCDRHVRGGESSRPDAQNGAADGRRVRRQGRQVRVARASGESADELVELHDRLAQVGQLAGDAHC